MTNPSSQAAKFFHWTARTLNGIILLFWGLLFVAHLIGDAGRPSRTLAWVDYVIMASLAVAAWPRAKLGSRKNWCSNLPDRNRHH